MFGLENDKVFLLTLCEPVVMIVKMHITCLFKENTRMAVMQQEETTQVVLMQRHDFKAATKTRMTVMIK